MQPARISEQATARDRKRAAGVSQEQKTACTGRGERRQPNLGKLRRATKPLSAGISDVSHGYSGKFGEVFGQLSGKNLSGWKILICFLRKARYINQTSAKKHSHKAYRIHSRHSQISKQQRPSREFIPISAF